MNFIVIHVIGSVVALSLIIITFGFIREYFRDYPVIDRGSWWMLLCVGLQIVLGVIALIVLLHDSGQGDMSLAQVLLSSSHLIAGTILMGSCACVMLGTLRLQSG